MDNRRSVAGAVLAMWRHFHLGREHEFGVIATGRVHRCWAETGQHGVGPDDAFVFDGF